MNILFPIISGSEIRQFFLSEVVSELINSKHEVFIIVKYDNDDLRNEVNKIEPRIKILKYIQIPIDKTKFSYLLNILDEWHEENNMRWRYSPKTQSSLIKRSIKKVIIKLLSIKIIRKVAFEYEKKWATKIDVNEFEKILVEHRIEKVIVNNARILFYPELLITCLNLKIPVDIVYHSNKEIYAQPRISYSYGKFGVWNIEMFNELSKRYPFLISKLKIIGNSHFSYLTNKSKFSIDDNTNFKFSKTKENQILILYTAAGIIVKNEFLFIEFLVEILKEKDVEYKIIVRKNPMDTTNVWENFCSSHDRIFLNIPKWKMDLDKGINFTMKEDLEEYKSLLKNIDFCVNIPSTVTLECAIMKKPLINICFNIKGVEITTNNKKIDQFWYAPYYMTYHNLDFVLPSFSKADIERNLDFLIDKENNFIDYDRCVQNVLGVELDIIKDNILNFITN